MTNDELLHKWINHTLTPEELQEFQQRPEYESLVLLYKNTASYRAPRFEGDTMLTEILAQPKQQPQTRTAKRVVFKWQRYAAAAAVFFAIGLLVWYQTGNPTLVTHQTARADTFEGQLPDGSSFTLYSESKLNYNTDNWTQNRTLNLDGEALFRVAKGAAFRVKTQNGQVQVLGTTFHVQSRKRILNVTCQEGKVAILNTQDTPLRTLTERQGIRLEDEQVIDTWAVPNDGNQTQNVYRFRQTPLRTVLEEIERQHDVTIQAVAIPMNEVISCNFPRNKLAVALESCLVPLGIQYKIDGNTVTLENR